MASFLDPLNLEYIDGRSWKVITEFDYAVGSKDSNVIIHIPVGFITDFASVPQVLWNLVPPTGTYGKAAVVHDALYRNPVVMGLQIDRFLADSIFFEAMTVLNVKWLTKRILYWGVRLGGFVTWNRYRNREGA